MILSREAIQRMITDEIGGGGGGAGISGSALANLLTGYATQDWVGENYISIEFFSRLFQAHGTENGVQTDIDPNDTTTTITSIESMFGFWTDYYLSALGNGGGLGSTLYLSTLADVLISSPANNQVLTYNASTGKWVNANAQAGAADLASLTDVTLSNPAVNQVLLYNGTQWSNSELKTINGYSIIGAGNISISTSVGSTRILQNYYTSRPSNANIQLGDGSFIQFRATGSMTSNKPPADGPIMHFAWDNNGGYDCQMWMVNNPVEYGNARVCVRGQKEGTWSRWYDVLTETNFSNWALPKSGGVLDIANDKFYTSGQYGIDMHNSDIIGCNNIIWQDQSDSAGEAIVFVNNGRTSYMSFWANVSEETFHFCRPFNIYNASDNPTSGRCQIRPTYGGGAFMLVDNYTIGLHIGGGRVNRGIYDWTSGIDNWLIGFNASNTFLIFGNIGIGTENPSYKLHVNGTIYATGAVTALSDIRKKDVLSTDIGLTVEQIADAPTIKFLWKDRRNEGIQVGSVAQFWGAHLPEVVMDKGGELSMQYGVAALVSAIITARKVVDHERRIQALEDKERRLG